MSYAGDVTCSECWSSLTKEAHAQLVDVRTSAEWAFVGIPDLSQIKKKTHMVEWQSFPTMEVDPGFATRVAQSLSSATNEENCPVFMICRSGARSMAAATALTHAGFGQVFNVLEGFEGVLNEAGQRGKLGGWKAENLPWRQS